MDKTTEPNLADLYSQLDDAYDAADEGDLDAREAVERLEDKIRGILDADDAMAPPSHQWKGPEGILSVLQDLDAEAHARLMRDMHGDEYLYAATV
jgi:hypothetical protein